MKKILIIQNKRIGDVLLSSVIADNIKLVFPNSEVHFLAYDYTTGVLEHHKSIDKILTINEKWLKKIPNLIKKAFQLKSEKYDIVFDPYSKFQSRFICFISNATYKIGYSRKNKKPLLNPYTHNVAFLEKGSKPCGKSLQDRVNLVTSVFDVKHEVYKPKIHLKENELDYKTLAKYKEKPIIVFGVFGSNPKKSMPSEYIIELINSITENFDVYIVFNYAPYQKDDAKAIYDKCDNKSRIIFDIYEDSIRGFIKLMNASTMLIANEGGSVHIAKALDKPTFTIYSPYILRESWASFENEDKHTSVHLLDYKPNVFAQDRQTRKKIEENPQFLYQEFKPELFKTQLHNFVRDNS